MYNFFFPKTHMTGVHICTCSLTPPKKSIFNEAGSGPNTKFLFKALLIVLN